MISSILALLATFIVGFYAVIIVLVYALFVAFVIATPFIVLWWIFSLLFGD